MSSLCDRVSGIPLVHFTLRRDVSVELLSNRVSGILQVFD